MKDFNSLRVLKVDQPLGEFYIGAIDSKDLIKIATVDVRSFEEGNPAKIAGIQRPLSPSRVKTLSEYVNLDYATFPTSVIIAVSELCATLAPIEGCPDLFELAINEFKGDEENGAISIDDAAFIIDGQHRLAGLEKLDDTKKFEINVSIFIGADMTDKAEIFSRVNLAQTKVNKSLVYDLLDYAKETSPYKVAHEIAIALNREPDGPFEHKIKRLGTKTPGVDKETLAQATVVNGLLKYLPRDQEKERSKGLFGLIKSKEPNESWQKRIFVNFYREEDAASIFEIVSNYFRAVRRKWPKSWDDVQEGQILNRTTGYIALIRFLKEAYLELAKEPRVVTEEEFFSLLDKFDLKDNSFTKDNYPPGGSGPSKLFKQFDAELKNKDLLL